MASHANAINVFLAGIGNTRLGRIQTRLQENIKDISSGRETRSKLAITDAKGETFADTEWTLLGADLVEDGFPQAVVESHKCWFTSRVEQVVLNGHHNEVASGHSSRTGFKSETSRPTGEGQY
jgi:hypothetical protein